MKILFLLFAFMLATVQAYTLEERQEWTLFKSSYGKNYKNANEEIYRMSIYMSNARRIAEHNKIYELGEVTYKKKLNTFSDMTVNEFNEKYYNRLIVSDSIYAKSKEIEYKMNLNARAPSLIDWREKGVVTRVKDQGNCSACWAFSAIGSIESHIALVSGKLTEFSEQNLIDCVTDAHGCEGGDITTAFAYVINHGINPESEYKFEEKTSTCMYKQTEFDGHFSAYVKLLGSNEETLKEIVGTQGPVSVAFHAKTDFADYNEGIYTTTNCPTNKPNHGVTIVGYGTENDKDYWLVKNSWGLDWGSKGYIKIARNVNNLCGIASAIFFPQL